MVGGSGSVHWQWSQDAGGGSTEYLHLRLSVDASCHRHQTEGRSSRGILLLNTRPTEKAMYLSSEVGFCHPSPAQANSASTIRPPRRAGWDSLFSCSPLTTRGPTLLPASSARPTSTGRRRDAIHTAARITRRPMRISVLVMSLVLPAPASTTCCPRLRPTS